jgi:hypothetical protein
MNKKEEAAPFWLPPLSLAAIAVMTIILWATDHRSIGYVGQAALLAVLARAFIYWPATRRWAARIPTPHRVVLAVLLLAMVIGHLTLQSARYFPFVAWEIFPLVREEDPVTCREFIATTSDGRTKRLLVEQLFPSIVQFNPPADNDSPAMAKLVDAMARAYNEQHPAVPTQRIDLVRVSIPLHPAAGQPFPSCELIKSFPIFSARSN